VQETITSADPWFSTSSPSDVSITTITTVGGGTMTVSGWSTTMTNSSGSVESVTEFITTIDDDTVTDFITTYTTSDGSTETFTDREITIPSYTTETYTMANG
jgi:small-conductance mechanosensitive channel